MRWVDADFENFKALGGSFDSYHQLNAVKFDVSANLSMGLLNMLRKDYAEVRVNEQTIGFSTVVVPLESFLDLDLSALVRSKQAAFSTDKDALVVLSFNTQPEPKRQILIYSETPALLNSISSIIQTDSQLEASPNLLDIPHSRAFNQQNPGPSRKYVLPLIRSALAS